jgi:antibiotic biosynthesis monooxygenase (ABM) superfamily enzyme
MFRGLTVHVQHDHETPEDPITVAIERRVDAHRQAEALAWVQTGTSLASRMPGYLGSGWVRANGSSSLWYTLYRFADAGSLAAWESSAERSWWLRSGEEFVHDARVERRTGIEGWFDVPASSLLAASEQPAPRAAPPRWKQAVTIWLGFFPTNLVFTLLVSLLPVWGAVPLALRVLITTVVLTPVMTYVVLPYVTARLRPWLERRPASEGPTLE